MSGTERVVIVGAGVSGLAAARELATDREVLVLDAGGVAADTSSRASGVISLSLEPIPGSWSTFAREAFRDLDGEGVFSFVERETVRLVREGAEPPEPDGTEASGFHTAAALADRYPGSFGDLSGYAGGVVYGGTGYLDALDYAMTLKWAAERAGAAVFRDHRVTGLRVEDGDVTGVETEYGPIDADHVVYATGWRTRDLLAEHVELPVRPMRWNAVLIEPTEPLPPNCPLGSEPGNRIYWRSTDRGDVLIGGNEHLLADPEGTPMGVDAGFRDLVLEEVAPVLRGVADGRRRREDCCPTADSASPDGLPIVDAPREAPDGLVAVTGLHGRGVMLSPVVGRAVRSLLTGDEAPFPTEPLRLDRFEDRSTDFEYLSHWE
ncbi:FAD-binding oxidoreductase [Halobacteriales archaeon QS_5_70_15]|nr:MAG: FAD-binding oxidoreductase [Halobacteriales archaeon QS_5_70_15]